MKLWLISQTANIDYDTYDSAVVAADTEEQARDMHPGEYDDEILGVLSSWAPKLAVKVKYLGDAADGTEAGVICASFNAG